MAALLLVQSIVGVVVNHYMTIPANHPGANASDFFPGIGSVMAWAISGGALALAAHVLLGLALIVVSVAVPNSRPALASYPPIRAAHLYRDRERRPPHVAPSTTGLRDA